MPWQRLNAILAASVYIVRPTRVLITKKQKKFIRLIVFVSSCAQLTEEDAMTFKFYATFNLQKITKYLCTDKNNAPSAL